MVGSNPEAIINKVMQDADDLDFDGDVPEELAKAFQERLEAQSGYWGKHLNAAKGIVDYIVHPTKVEHNEIQSRLQVYALDQIESKIKQASSSVDLERINYSKLSSGLKRTWSDASWRIRAQESSAEDIASGYHRTVGSFAKFYRLSDSEATTLLQDKGVLSADGRKIKTYNQLTEGEE